MSETMKQNLIIPEVMGEMADSLFGQKMSLMKVCKVDTTLEGVPGDTLKFPCFRYIGKAEEVPENGDVPLGVLTADTTEVKVKKFAKAVCLTDEARLCGFGDPVGEAARQLSYAIDHAVDEEMYGILKNLPLRQKSVYDTLTADTVADALTLFGDDPDGEKYLFVDAEGFAALRKDPGYIRASDLGQETIFFGVVGEIWGCRIVLSSRLKEDAETKEKNYYILKPGALRLVSKQKTIIEKKREPEKMRDTIFASRHLACYLYDAQKAIALTKFTGLEQLSGGMTLERGETLGSYILRMEAHLQPPGGYAWYVKPADSAMGISYQTAYQGAPWPGEGQEIPLQDKSYLQAVLCDSQKMPVKYLLVEAPL
ncbi:MAG TPA: hypothetical protein GXZ86_02275 [Clostridiales bacterium]|jgi:hypothetical protein|nr:hypothetical protein [Clostridiales bacterium]